MSREIKFRAWDSFAKKFKYGRRVIDHYTNWEQSTGLKDKNGKEIYEGDLLRCKGAYGDDFYFEVVWAGDGWFVHEFRTNGSTISLNDDSARLGYWFDREVIGNIHENPELIGIEE